MLRNHLVRLCKNSSTQVCWWILMLNFGFSKATSRPIFFTPESCQQKGSCSLPFASQGRMRQRYLLLRLGSSTVSLVSFECPTHTRVTVRAHCYSFRRNMCFHHYLPCARHICRDLCGSGRRSLCVYGCQSGLSWGTDRLWWEAPYRPLLHINFLTIIGATIGQLRITFIIAKSLTRPF